jgi:hypothetical protein
MATAPKLEPHQRKLVCGVAICEERALGRYERGERVRPSTKARIERAMRVLGLERFIRVEPEAKR